MRRRTVAAGLVLALALAVTAGCGGSESAGSAGGPAMTPGWPPPADPVAASRRAGLPTADREMLDHHLHTHLTVLVEDRSIVVPADLGIQREPKLIAPLHTHDTSGVVHIESAVDVPFTLGQVFTLWDMPLRPDQVGPERVAAGSVLRVFRNGEEMAGDPTEVELTQHAEIVVWVGPAADRPDVPDSYRFPKGT
jgi:hypothetical protein